MRQESNSNGSSFVDRFGSKMLGITSLGLGLTELTAPQQIERWLGIGQGKYSNLLRVLGLRELLHALDLLFHSDPTPGVRARVIGDLLDGALFGLAATRTRRPSGYARAALLLAGITALDILLDRRLHSSSEAS